MTVRFRLNLSEIEQVLTEVGLLRKTVGEAKSREITLATHVDEVSASSLFVAYTGVSFDRHSVIGQAVGKGMAAVILENDAFLQPTTVLQFLVTDARKAWSVLCAQGYGNPQRNLDLIGVTGTNGKTSTVWILHNLLQLSGIKGTAIGTLGISGGLTMLKVEDDQKSESSKTTPENHVTGTSTYISSKGQSIEAVRKQQKEFFESGSTRPWEVRDRNLRLVLESLQDNKERILEAAHQDLGKPSLEAFVTEYAFVVDEIKNIRKNLKRWMRPKRINPGPLIFPGKTKIVSEPLGQVLVIAPWNYPIQLLLTPIVGALAAGNTIVAKPSELTPNSSKLMAEILGEIFTEDLVAVFEGDASTSTALLQQPWNHIFFTGSTQVGRVVAEAAAKTLSPVTLELGGKSPCIVDKNCNLKLAARRIVWGKFFNAGQTCVAPDYVLVEQSIKEEFLKLCVENIKKFYSNDPAKSPDYGRIVSKRHCERLAKFVEGGRVYYGGLANIEDRYFSPTILDVVDNKDQLMQEEIFGPIMPVLAFEKVQEVFDRVRKGDRPLALYLFTHDERLIEEVTSELSFGGGCINDTIMHLANHNLPFGGIGASGIGNYHGPFSFDTFSHKKALLTQNSWFDIPARYPPFNTIKNKIFELLMG